MVLLLSSLEPREYAWTGQLLIQMKRSDWCALHRERNQVLEIISCLARRTLAYVALVGAAIGDLIRVIPEFFSGRLFNTGALQFIVSSITMPILGLGVWFNALPNVHPRSSAMAENKEHKDLTDIVKKYAY